MKNRLLFLFIGLPIIFTVFPALLCFFLMQKYGKSWWKSDPAEEEQHHEQDLEKLNRLAGSDKSERESSETSTNRSGGEDTRNETEGAFREGVPVRLTFLQQAHAAGYR